MNESMKHSPLRHFGISLGLFCLIGLVPSCSLFRDLFPTEEGPSQAPSLAQSSSSAEQVPNQDPPALHLELPEVGELLEDEKNTIAVFEAAAEWIVFPCLTWAYWFMISTTGPFCVSTMPAAVTMGIFVNLWLSMPCTSTSLLATWMPLQHFLQGHH